MSGPAVLVYTAPGCPDCVALTAWLKLRNVAFQTRDLSQPGVADEAKARYGVRVAPITVVGESCFYGTFEQQKPTLEAHLIGAADP